MANFFDQFDAPTPPRPEIAGAGSEAATRPGVPDLDVAAPARKTGGNFFDQFDRPAAAAAAAPMPAIGSEAATRSGIPGDTSRMPADLPDLIRYATRSLPGDKPLPAELQPFAPKGMGGSPLYNNTPTTHRQGMLQEAVASGLAHLADMPATLDHMIRNLPGNLVDLGAYAIGSPYRTPASPDKLSPTYFHDLAREKGLVGKPEYQPQGSGEKFAFRTVEGAFSNPFGPAGMVYGALSGAGGELLAEALGEKYRWIGQLGTPVAMAAAKRLVLASPDRVVAGQLAKLSPDELVRAQKLYDSANEMGRPITVPEAVAQVTGGRNTRLLNAQRYAENTERGSEVFDPMMAERARANQTLPDQVAAVGPKPADATNVVPRLQDAAKDVQGTARQLRNTITKPLYDASGVNNPGTVLSGARFHAISQEPLITDAIAAVRRDSRYGNFQGMADNAYPVLDAARKWLSDEAATLRSGTSPRPEALMNVERAATTLENAMDTQPGVTQLLPVARRANAQLREQLDAPIERGQVGSLARITEKDAEQRFGQAADILFPKDPKTVTPEAVTKAVRQLQFKDPTAARDFTRLYLESEFNKAVGNIPKAPDFAGAKFRDVVMGNPQQAANLEAAIKALPEGERAWKGFQALMDVFEAQGRRLPQNSPTEFNRVITEDMKGGSKLAGAAKTVANPAMVVGRFKDALDWMQYGRNTERLAEILTDRESLSQLGRLRLMKPGSSAAAAVAAGVLARRGDEERRR